MVVPVDGSRTSARMDGFTATPRSVTRATTAHARLQRTHLLSRVGGRRNGAGSTGGGGVVGVATNSSRKQAINMDRNEIDGKK